MHLKTLAAIAATLSMFVIAQPASADDFCVGSSTTCNSPLGDFDFDRAGLLAAVTAAGLAPGDDTVHIAAGTIPLSTNLSFTASGSQRLTIVGAGADQTKFSSSLSSAVILGFGFSNQESSASDFKLEISGAPSASTGISVTQGSLERFEFEELDTGAGNLRAVSLLNDARLEDSSVRLRSSGSTGVVTQNGSATVDSVAIRGPGGSGNGVASSTSGVVALEHLDIAGFFTGITHDSGTLNVADSLIDLGSQPSARGVSTFNENPSSSTIVTHQVRNTIVGSGSNQIGMVFGADSPGETFDGTFEDLLLFGTGSNFSAGNCYGGGGTLTVDLQRWASNSTITAFGGCTLGLGERVDLVAEPPLFRDFDGGDFRLRADSPLIDRALVNAPSWTDLLGRPRQVDGDDDGVAAVDLGAYEYQRSAPVVSLAASRAEAEIAEAVTFTATASDADDEALTYAWTVDGAASPEVGSSLTTSFATPGQHTVEVKVSDFAGVVSAAASSVGIKHQPSGAASASYARIISKPKKSFKRGRKGFTVGAAKNMPNFAVLFGDCESASLALSSVGKKGKLKKLKGKQTLKVKNGTTRIGFGGRWNKKKLKAGRYRVTITPIGADGIAGKAVTVKIKLT